MIPRTVKFTSGNSTINPTFAVQGKCSNVNKTTSFRMILVMGYQRWFAIHHLKLQLLLSILQSIPDWFHDSEGMEVKNCPFLCGCAIQCPKNTQKERPLMSARNIATAICFAIRNSSNRHSTFITSGSGQSSLMQCTILQQPLSPTIQVIPGNFQPPVLLIPLKIHYQMKKYSKLAMIVERA